MDVTTLVTVGALAFGLSTTLAGLTRAFLPSNRAWWWIQWLAIGVILLFTVAREALLFHRRWVYEGQNERDMKEVAGTCNAIEGKKLRYTKGTKNDCDYAFYVLNTTSFARTLEAFTERLTTISSLWEWVQANWLLATCVLVTASVVLSTLFDRGQNWSLRQMELYMRKYQQQLAAEQHKPLAAM